MPQTDTYQWTIRSNTAITSGTFFDGTPWIVDNGGLTLTNVTPARVTVTDYIEGGTFSGETMITVLNPDFGLFIPASQGITGDPKNVSTTKTYATGPSAGEEVTQSRVLSPFDFRAGSYTNGGTGNIGTGFDSTQGLTLPGEYKLSAGDMIVTNYGYTGDITGDDFDKPWTESYGCLTVLASAPGASAFRPPVNWDPNDKANRPVFYENDTLNHSGNMFTYPNYSISGASAWTGTYIAYSPTNPNINLDRPGTITPFFASRDPNNARGTLKIQASVSDEYGNYQATAEDAMMLSVFDPAVAGATREIYRRTIAQRGIDTWGQIASMGAAIRANGGHNPEYHPRVFFAWCVTGATAMLDFLNLTAYGSTASGTRLNRQQKPGEPFGLGDYNADIHEGAFVSFRNQMCSFRHFDIPVVSQGSTSNQNWVRISRPASLTEYAGTGKTGYAPIWLSTSSSANAGRNWGFCDNNKYVGKQGQSSQINSGYIRIKGTSGGSAYSATSRIIWTDWYNQSGDLTTSAEDKRNPYEARFWLQDNVVPTSGTITEVDLCDALQETRSSHMSRHITYTLSNFTAESATQAYTYSTMSNLLSAWKLVQAKGGSASVPFWGARKAQHAEYMAADIRGKQQLLSNWSGTYNWGATDPKDSLYYALMRQGPGAGKSLAYTPYEYTKGYAPTTPGTTAEMWNAGYTLSASGTWEELGFDITKIRVYSSIRTSNNSNDYYRFTQFGGTGGGVTGTTYDDKINWTVASYKDDGSISLRIKAAGSPGTTWGWFNRNDWSVYLWTKGLTAPIGMTLESGGGAADSDTSWNAYYVPTNPVASMNSAYPPPNDSGTAIFWADNT
jgi:hypothetical protein